MVDMGLLICVPKQEKTVKRKPWEKQLLDTFIYNLCCIATCYTITETSKLTPMQ